ncbi:MAG: MaoC/PaaZ C-terminal domain-containing protein [Actinomycetales bacterium]
MTAPTLSGLSVGDVVINHSTTLERSDLVRYAGASGDFNAIHWNPAFATSVGLPDTIVHGMLTMGRAIAPVSVWAGDPAAVSSYGVRFTKPIVMPYPGSATIDITGTVGAIDVDAGTARIDLTVTVGGGGVLGKARAEVRLAS